MTSLNKGWLDRVEPFTACFSQMLLGTEEMLCVHVMIFEWVEYFWNLYSWKDFCGTANNMTLAEKLRPKMIVIFGHTLCLCLYFRLKFVTCKKFNFFCYCVMWVELFKLYFYIELAIFSHSKCILLLYVYMESLWKHLVLPCM